MTDSTPKHEANAVAGTIARPTEAVDQDTRPEEQHREAPAGQPVTAQPKRPSDDGPLLFERLV